MLHFFVYKIKWMIAWHNRVIIIAMKFIHVLSEPFELWYQQEYSYTLCEMTSCSEFQFAGHGPVVIYPSKYWLSVKLLTWVNVCNRKPTTQRTLSFIQFFILFFKTIIDKLRYQLLFIWFQRILQIVIQEYSCQFQYYYLFRGNVHCIFITLYYNLQPSGYFRICFYFISYYLWFIFLILLDINRAEPRLSKRLREIFLCFAVIWHIVANIGRARISSSLDRLRHRCSAFVNRKLLLVSLVYIIWVRFVLSYKNIFTVFFPYAIHMQPLTVPARFYYLNIP